MTMESLASLWSPMYVLIQEILRMSRNFRGPELYKNPDQLKRSLYTTI